MMDSLRNFLTGPRLLIVVLFCALPFVFLGTSSLGTVFNTSFGTINGEEVNDIDLQIASDITVQKFKTIYGEDFDFDMLDDQIKSDAIKQELIFQKSLLSGAKSLGFVNKSSERETKKNIIKSPNFQFEGEFSEDIFEAQVNSRGFTKDNYIDVMTNLAASDLYLASLSMVNFITKNELIEIASLLEMTSDINFIKINFNDLKSQINNSNEELLNYYKENEILFFSDELKSFKYILLNQSDYAEVIQIPDSYLENGYQNYLEGFKSTDEIRISHIMIDKSNYESREFALDEMNKVQNLLGNGENFIELASTYSEDVVTSDIGGDLEYFDKDIFPIEFNEAIQKLDLNQTSEIIELEETFHILKVTEKNILQPLSEDQVKRELLTELKETESFALMQDDLNEIENMIMENNTINEISDVLSKAIKNSELYSQSNFDFDIASTEVSNYIFSPDSKINQPYLIELKDNIIILEIDRVIEPFLQDFDSIKESISSVLSESKAIDKILLMSEEIKSILNEKERMEFIKAYDYVEYESYVDVNRYSSLLPREVLNEIFNSSPGKTITKDSFNGDKYIVNISGFNEPTETDINNILEEYGNFSKQILDTKMNQIINKDIFESARVNLNNLIF
ncbi:MAG: peptidylprolyl isomerase [Gammaproteobacteria bacterium]|nr:peptidylprolyl isomerase [Gammaproteobacteria bacterium]